MMTAGDRPVEEGSEPRAGKPLADRSLDQPHPSRLAPDRPRREEILAAHRRALDAEQAGYLDPDTGLFVLTAAYLAERGRCCASGCRHCPYLS
jgi:hypothetical protein